MKILILLGFVISSMGLSEEASVSDSYRHGYTIEGRLTVTDTDKQKCKIKKPMEQLLIYIEEVSDFLIPRGTSTKLGPTGEFYFEVDSRYMDYRFVVLVIPSNFVAYKTTFFAYNAPKTYELTLSCINDMNSWEGQ